MRRALVADLHARGGRPVRAAALLLEEARDAVAAGALATAHEILGRAGCWPPMTPACSQPITVERIQAFALAARTEDAIAAADAALPDATGADRTALAVAVARACVAGQHFDVAGRYLTLADPDDARVEALAAHIALNADDLDRALALANRAAAAAERTGPPDVVCEALEVVGRALRRRDPAASNSAFERAERVAARHGLAPWRIRALAELGTAEVFGAAPRGVSPRPGSSLSTPGCSAPRRLSTCRASPWPWEPKGWSASWNVPNGARTGPGASGSPGFALTR